MLCYSNFMKWNGSCLAVGLLSVFGCSSNDGVEWTPNAAIAKPAAINLPMQDGRGRNLPTGRALKVLVLPACDSCSVSKLPTSALDRIVQSVDVVVAFSKEQDAKRQFPALADASIPLFFEPLPDGIPSSLEAFAPSCLRVDSSGQILSYEAIQ